MPNKVQLICLVHEIFSLRKHTNFFLENNESHHPSAEQQKATVRQSMDEYESLTGGCITFVERSHEHDYIHFTQE